jgi:hypothetical protein
MRWWKDSKRSGCGGAFLTVIGLDHRVVNLLCQVVFVLEMVAMDTTDTGLVRGP